MAQDITSSALALLPITNAILDYVTAPTLTTRILPEDIEKDSILMERFATNSFVVRFRYTEVGAQKMLDFNRQHAGLEVITKVGHYEYRATVARLSLRPAGWTEEGWLKRRTSKFVGVSEDDAKKIVQGLRKE